MDACQPINGPVACANKVVSLPDPYIDALGVIVGCVTHIWMLLESLLDARNSCALLEE